MFICLFYFKRLYYGCVMISVNHIVLPLSKNDLTGGFKPTSTCWSAHLTTVKEEFLPNSN